MITKSKIIRCIAFLLAFALIAGSVPGTAFADDTDYQFGAAEYYSKISKDYVPVDFYYTDDWFSAGPAQANGGLALISAKLAASGGEAEHCAAFLSALGFTDVASKRFGSTENDCAYTIGTKTVNGKTLAAVVFQGDLYGDKGWQQNVTINIDGTDTKEQASYAAAAQAFLADLDAMSLGNDVTLWVTGQSRGGAVANLASAYLLDRADAPQVFCYTFESPATTSDAEKAGGGKYAGIHNYVCGDDPVAMLPVWGMVRYGQDIVYDTDPVEDVQAEAVRLNPAAEELVQNYNPAVFDGDVKGYLEELMASLELIVPTREAYTKALIASFETGAGEEVDFSYTYQEGLQTLCHLIFGVEGETMSKLSPLLDILPALTYSYVEESYAVSPFAENTAELLDHAARLRWEAACGFCEEIGEGGPDSLVSQKGMYALLRFLSPLLIHLPDMTQGDWELPPYDEEWIDNYTDYFDYGIIGTLSGGSSTLVFSHHPDVILARLSLQAPAPAMEDVALTITAPAAGDENAKAPGEAGEAVEGLDLSWLVCEDAAWLTEDDPLQDGKLYYLQLTLSAAGHTVPEDLSVTLNGEEAEECEIAYPGGPAIITATWPFQLGEEQQAVVRYDMNGHGEAPASYTVPLGTMLAKAEQTPEEPGMVKDETGCWMFAGWSGEDGTPWDELTADGDVTLYASWTRVIDEIVLTYDIPRVGDSGDPLLEIGLPEDAPYMLVDGQARLIDEDWNYVEQIDSTEPLLLRFYLTPVSGDILFLTEEDEYGGMTYTGTITINGEEIGPFSVYWDLHYEDEDDEVGTEMLWFDAEYGFTPLEKASPGKPDPSDKPAEPDEPAESSEPAGETKRFVDVPENAYYAKAVDWAVAEGVTAGTDETHFSPDEGCTRAQIMTMLWAAAGAPAESGTSGFEDVPEDAYYAKAVAWALEKGITSGVDASHFAPGRTVSRAEVITFLYLFAGEKTEADCPFADVPEGAYYAGAVRWAYAAGVTAGTDAEHFSPDAPCTRAQVVTFLYLVLGQD
ncbi:MAG: S-layer homology domain-containing protein [Firmicutes bacterium]|nr:S-layer homology domain-containing protein [Bacillota bacterium]